LGGELERFDNHSIVQDGEHCFYDSQHLPAIKFEGLTVLFFKKLKEEDEEQQEAKSKLPSKREEI